MVREIILAEELKDSPFEDIDPGDVHATIGIRLDCDEIQRVIEAADAIRPPQAMNRYLNAIDNLKSSLSLSQKFKRSPS